MWGNRHLSGSGSLACGETNDYGISTRGVEFGSDNAWASYLTCGNCEATTDRLCLSIPGSMYGGFRLEPSRREWLGFAAAICCAEKLGWIDFSCCVDPETATPHSSNTLAFAELFFRPVILERSRTGNEYQDKQKRHTNAFTMGPFGWYT